MESQLTEIALEDINRGDVGSRISLSVKSADGRLRVGRASRRRGEHEVRERSLEGCATEDIVILELTSLAVDTREDILHDRFSHRGSTNCRAISRRGLEIAVNRECSVLRGVRGRPSTSRERHSTSTSGLKPLVETTGQIRGRTTSIGLSTVVGAEGRFHITLDGLNALSDIVSEFITNTSNGRDILRKRGHTDRASEDLDVVRQFSTILLGSVSVLGVVIVGRDICAVNRASCLGEGQSVCLPSEKSISRFATLLSHRGEGGILRINERDEVSEFFSLARREGGFCEISHSSI